MATKDTKDTKATKDNKSKVTKSKASKSSKSTKKESNPVGRPPKYSDPAIMEKKIKDYFNMCDANTEISYSDAGDEITIHNPLPYTNSGLCLALDLTKQGLLEYQEKPEFSDIVKKAKLKLEYYNELQLYKAKNPTGIIFQLKANYGWQDKIVMDNNVTIKNKLEDFFGGEEDA